MPIHHIPPQTVYKHLTVNIPTPKVATTIAVPLQAGGSQLVRCCRVLAEPDGVGAGGCCLRISRLSMNTARVAIVTRCANTKGAPSVSTRATRNSASPPAVSKMVFAGSTSHITDTIQTGKKHIAIRTKILRQPTSPTYSMTQEVSLDLLPALSNSADRTWYRHSRTARARSSLHLRPPEVARAIRP